MKEILEDILYVILIGAIVLFVRQQGWLDEPWAAVRAQYLSMQKENVQVFGHQWEAKGSLKVAFGLAQQNFDIFGEGTAIAPTEGSIGGDLIKASSEMRYFIWTNKGKYEVASQGLWNAIRNDAFYHFQFDGGGKINSAQEVK